MKNNVDLSTEQGCIDWIKLNTSQAISSSTNRKKQFVYPFSSRNAFTIVTEYLGKELFKMLEESKTFK